MELARMFATLGFKVDQTGLNSFEGALRSLRSTAAKLNAELKPIGTQLDVLKKKASNLNKVLNQDVKTKKLGSNTQESYSRLAKYVERVNDANEGVTKHAPKLIESLGNIRAAVHKGANAWERYAKNINSAKEDMRTFKQSISDLRRGTGNVNVRNQYYGGQGGSRVYNNQQQPQDNNTSLMMLGGIGGGIKNFFRSMTPATALAGGAASAGFAVKEVVQAGREVQKMRQSLLVATGDAEKQAQALAYVDREAKRLGISYVELGQAYSKAKIAVGEQLSTGQLEKMLTGVAELATTLNLTQDDQKGVFRAMSQMFTKEKISLEEINQMAERGIPAYKMMKDAAMSYYKVDNEGFQKMIQKGSVITKEIFPLMAEQMSVMARRGGALEQATKSSVAAQQRLVDEWKKFSYEIMQSGLDKTLSFIFNKLADLLGIMTPFLKGLGAAAKAIYEVVASNKLLIATLAAGVLGFIALRKATGNASLAVSILNGNFLTVLKTIIRVGGRIFWIVGALAALAKGFYDVGKANEGTFNWVTVARAKFELLFSSFDLALTKFKLFKQKWFEIDQSWELMGKKASDRVVASLPAGSSQWIEYNNLPKVTKNPMTIPQKTLDNLREGFKNKYNPENMSPIPFRAASQQVIQPIVNIDGMPVVMNNINATTWQGYFPQG